MQHDTWVNIRLENAGVRSGGAIHIVGPQTKAEHPNLCSITANGLAAHPVHVTAATPLESLLCAMGACMRLIDAYRSSGGRVLFADCDEELDPQHVPILFRPILERHGYSESDKATVVSGPTFQESGAVEFLVLVGLRAVNVSLSPLGMGCGDGEPLDVTNAACRAVSQHVEKHHSEELGWYREAARVRRAAGKPPPIPVQRTDSLRLIASATPNGELLLLRFQTQQAELRVVLAPPAAIGEDSDDWTLVTEADRSAAYVAAVDYVLQNRELAASVGIDVDALEEIWR
jgi:hypothetical protein